MWEWSSQQAYTLNIILITRVIISRQKSQMATFMGHSHYTDAVDCTSMTGPRMGTRFFQLAETFSLGTSSALRPSAIEQGDALCHKLYLPPRKCLRCALHSSMVWHWSTCCQNYFGAKSTHWIQQCHDAMTELVLWWVYEFSYGKWVLITVRLIVAFDVSKVVCYQAFEGLLLHKDVWFSFETRFILNVTKELITTMFTYSQHISLK